MSSSDEVQVVLRAADQGTELALLRDGTEVVAQGIGALEASLAPGLYKLRARAGNATLEEYLILRPGEQAPVHKALPPLRFASAAPLSDTLKVSERHVGPARSCSTCEGAESVAGSNLFVFVRDWRPQQRLGADRAPPSLPPAEVTLRDARGDRLQEVAAGRRSELGAPDPWSASSVHVPPGVYLLCTQRPGVGELQQTVVASPGWQTQVFLVREHDPIAGALALDPLRASILLARLGAGFDPSSEGARLAELARIGLVNGRQVLSRDVQALLRGPFEDPMLGLLGGHQLLLPPAPDLGLLRAVVQNLRRLLGPAHPDVEALALACDDTDHVFEAPPMLARSWSLVVQACARRPELVPRGSLAAWASPHLWGSGAWLVWQAEEAAPPSDRGRILGGRLKNAWPGEFLSVDQVPDSVEASIEAPAAPPAEPPLTELEAALLAYALPAPRGLPVWARATAHIGQLSLLSPSPEAAAAVEPEIARRLAEAGTAPPSVIQGAAADLRAKIGLQPWPASLDLQGVREHRELLSDRGRAASFVGLETLARALRSGALFWQRWRLDRATPISSALLEPALDLAEAAGEWVIAGDLIDAAASWSGRGQLQMTQRAGRVRAELARLQERWSRLRPAYQELLASPSEELGQPVLEEAGALPPASGNYVSARVYSALGRHDHAEQHDLLAVTCRPLHAPYLVRLAYEQAALYGATGLETLRAARRVLGPSPRLLVHTAHLALRRWLQEGGGGPPPIEDATAALESAQADAPDLTPEERSLASTIAERCARPEQGASAARDLPEWPDPLLPPEEEDAPGP